MLPVGEFRISEIWEADPNFEQARESNWLASSSFDDCGLKAMLF